MDTMVNDLIRFFMKIVEFLLMILQKNYGVDVGSHTAIMWNSRRWKGGNVNLYVCIAYNL